MQLEHINLTATGTRDQLAWALRDALDHLQRHKDKPAPHGSRGAGPNFSHEWRVTNYPPPECDCGGFPHGKHCAAMMAGRVEHTPTTPNGD